jgi:hypothetical protein
MVVTVVNGPIHPDEKQIYIDRVEKNVAEKFPGRKIHEIVLKLDGDFVDISWELEPLPGFQRIRRITGYLVGTLDRWNNGKLAEEHDRVTHSVETIEDVS